MTDVILFGDSSRYLQDGGIEIPVKSAGIFRIATEIRNLGLSCQIINYLFSFSIDETKTICEKYITENTQVIGFSCTDWFIFSAPVRDKALKIIKNIIDHSRNINPNIKIILGGANAESMNKMFKFDATFFGFSEEKLISYLTKKDITPTYIKDNTEYYQFDPHNYQFNFTKSDIRYNPSDHIVNGETVVIEVSRGCIFKCKFCTYLLNGKKKLDYIKDMEIIKNELIRNYESNKITNYIFSDDTFNDTTYKLQIMNDMLKTLPFKINFVCYLRLDLLAAHPEQILLLKEMGIRGAFFGVESFNDNSAKCIGKGMKSQSAKTLLYELKTKHWGNDVKISISLIIGLPYETIESVEETRNWILSDKCVVDGVTVFPLGINKNSDIWQSEFTLNSETYGYTIDDKGNWLCSKSEIKDLSMAKKLAGELDAIAKRKNINKSAFNIFYLSTLALFDDPPLTLENLIAMSNLELDTWRDDKKLLCAQRMIDTYKSKVLGG